MRSVRDSRAARVGGATPAWNPKEAAALTLSSALAQSSLQWHPRLGVGESLAWTADWYQAYAAGEDMLKFSESADCAVSVAAALRA